MTNSDASSISLLQVLWLKKSNHKEFELCRAALPRHCIQIPCAAPKANIGQLCHQCTSMCISTRSALGHRGIELTIQGSFLMVVYGSVMKEENEKRPLNAAGLVVIIAWIEAVEGRARSHC
jgi:hypothetical protein